MVSALVGRRRRFVSKHQSKNGGFAEEGIEMLARLDRSRGSVGEGGAERMTRWGSAIVLLWCRAAAGDGDNCRTLLGSGDFAEGDGSVRVHVSVRENGERDAAVVRKWGHDVVCVHLCV